jgi:hypothetical protein
LKDKSTKIYFRSNRPIDNVNNHIAIE